MEFILSDKSKDFSVATDDFGQLEIRSAGDKGFHYFYHVGDKRLVTDFVLRDGDQVATLCRVTLIKQEDTFEPRLRFWKRDKKSKKVVEGDVTATPATRHMRASVDTSDCHETFWKLIDFLHSFKGIEIPANEFRMANASDVALLDALQGHDKVEVLGAVKGIFGSDLSQADLDLLANRKAELSHFKALIDDEKAFKAEMTTLGTDKPEKVWQVFFERNPWIFGYGLTLVSCESFSDAKLEQMTTGRNVFTGGGKKADAVMRTRGFLSSLLFAEIKRHDTPLLKPSPYRPPDVYEVSDELSGGMSQVQKTAHKAVAKLDDLHRQHDAGGTPMFEVMTIRPRQVLVVGNLAELAGAEGTNTEKLSSFELYRRGQRDVEIITFDELYERAKFIVQD